MHNSISDNYIIDSFYNLLPYFPFMFDDDVSFGITDTQKYLKVQNSKSLVLKIKEGDKIPSSGAAYDAMKSGEVIVKIVPKEVYGVPFKSYAIPIKNEYNEVVGSILMGRSLANRNEILSLSQNLTISLSEISKAISALSSGVQNVLNMNNDIYTKVQVADESSKKTDDILKFIQGISTQTNMLGINAAIEAARAGELGKGFTVVASEIRKLSSSTSESVKQIDEVLKSISSSINNISSNINESNLIFEDQVATLEQIAASIEELNASSKSLISLSEKI